ncbi:MFS transporter [Nocardia asteroides]|uniref:MFS transporter n=1 Tax=Nocardia asteroides TaxID=1824 RepID=UPI00379A3296
MGWEENLHNRVVGQSTISALSLRDYRMYLTGTVVSNLGTWLHRVGQNWLVLDVSDGSAVAVGINIGLEFLPMIALSPLGGRVADHFKPGLVLRIAQVWMGVISAILGIVALVGQAFPWQLHIFAFLFGIGPAFGNPARQVFLFEIVGESAVSSAVSLNAVNFNIARLVGPVVAGVIIGTFGAGWAVIINAISYLPLIFAISVIEGRRRVSPCVRNISRPPIQANRFSWRKPVGRELILLLCLVFLVGTFGMNMEMAAMLMATEVFRVDAAACGILLACSASGAVCGSFLAARMRPTSLCHLSAIAFFFGVVEVFTGAMPTYPLFAASLFVVGVVSALFVARSEVRLHHIAEPGGRGRVFSMYRVASLCGTPIGAPALGFVGQAFGARWVLWAGGSVLIAGVIVVVLGSFVRIDRKRLDVRESGDLIEDLS